MFRFGAALALLLCLCPARFALAGDDVTAAREHFATGKRLYDLGRFLEAAQEYEAAYQAKDDPALLFNIGQAYRLGGGYPKAILAYKAFLRNVPDAPNRDEVAARIHEMQAVVDQQARTSQSPPQEVLPPSKTNDATPAASTQGTLTASAAHPRDATPVYKKWWLWTIVGVVAVGAAVGIGVGVTHASPSFPSASTTYGPVRF